MEPENRPYVDPAIWTYLRERDDTATRELVAALEDEANRQAKWFADAYELSPDEAYTRLQELGASAASFVGFLVQALPANLSGDRKGGPPSRSVTSAGRR